MITSQEQHVCSLEWWDEIDALAQQAITLQIYLRTLFERSYVRANDRGLTDETDRLRRGVTLLQEFKNLLMPVGTWVQRSRELERTTISEDEYRMLHIRLNNLQGYIIYNAYDRRSIHPGYLKNSTIREDIQRIVNSSNLFTSAGKTNSDNAVDIICHNINKIIELSRKKVTQDAV